MANPFDKFGLQTKKVVIEALDGMEVTVQELTVAQSTDFYKRAVKGLKEDGSIDLDYDELSEIKLEKVAYGMIMPTMTVAQLRALPARAISALDAIVEAIDSFDTEKEDAKK